MVLENPSEEHVRLENEFVGRVVELLPYKDITFEPGSVEDVPIIKFDGSTLGIYAQRQINITMDVDSIEVEYFIGAKQIFEMHMTLSDPLTTPTNVANRIVDLIAEGHSR